MSALTLTRNHKLEFSTCRCGIKKMFVCVRGEGGGGKMFILTIYRLSCCF